MNLKDTLIKNLFILMSVFIIGYGGIVVIHQYFTNLVLSFDKQIKNEHARYKIGEYILEEVNAIEANFYKMAVLTNSRGTKSVKEDIHEEIEDIKKAINILENGGTLDKYVKVNLVNLEKIHELITFIPHDNIEYTFEAIDLIPKLATIEKKLTKIDYILDLKNEILSSNSIEEKRKLRFEIQIFLKQIPPLFVRMKENASRLLYDSKLNSKEIQKKIDEKIAYYQLLEILLTALLMIIVIVFGFIISKQIQKKSIALKLVTEEARNSAIEASNANKVKSDFLANMSHEIRTPLNAIIGFSEILSQSAIDKKNKEQANIILKSAKSLLSIINDILDISKVESGKFEIVQEKFQARRFFEQVVELFSVNAEQKNIRFIYNFNTKIPTFLMGDQIRLKQVLSNLLSNAIKFTKEGNHVTLTIKIINMDEETVHLKFSVLDEGIGISKEQQENIFLPFSQEDTSISRKFGGTGLGLAISHKIISMMGSEIKVKSKKNKGSEFYFDLKFSIPENNAKVIKKLNYNFLVSSLNLDEENTKTNLINYLEELGHVVKLDNDKKNISDKIDLIFYFGEEELLEKITKVKEKNSCKIVYVGNRVHIDNKDIIETIDYYIDVPLYGSKIFNTISSACNIDKKEFRDEKIDKKYNAKILIAEDNENNQKLIEILLNKLGVVTKIASNGKEAIEYYNNEDFDMVFMDINMPIMDGLTALENIKKIDKYIKKKTPIVALTANTIKGDKERYLNAGMDNYLSKPIVMNELLHILNTYLVDDPLSKLLILKNDEEKSKEEFTSKISQEVSKPTKKSTFYKKEHTLKQLSLPEEIVDKLLSKFLSSLDEDIEKIEKAIELKNNSQIFDACHYLKGPSSNFAMHGAVELLVQFEKIAKENLDKEYEVKKLKDYFEKVKEELN